MRNTIRTALTAAALALAAQFPVSLSAQAVGTAFTYQGELQSQGSVYSGSADVQFKLFNAASGGSQIGSTQTALAVDVANGRFTAALDFGAAPFDGTPLWLEIAVRTPAGAGAYTTLSTRQALTATPFALFASSSAQWKSVGTAIQNANSGFVGVGRAAQVSGAERFGLEFANSGYGGMYIQGASVGAIPFYGYSTSEGSSVAWTEFDGSTKSWSVYNSGQRLTVTNTGRVGIGDATPDAMLDVTGASGVVGMTVTAKGAEGLQVSTDTGNGITGTSSAGFSYGVKGVGLSAGVYGQSSASDGAGVQGRDDTAGGTGVQGNNSSTSGGAGVAGYCSFGTGVYGQADSGYAIYGSNPFGSGYAGYFNGKVHVQGAFSANSKNFKIDHPVDPANKYLVHTSVESPDMKDLYDGVITLDATGAATVELPGYFEALNKDFRYQLTCVGGWAPVFVAEEVTEHHFRIAGGKPGMKVSWMLTGVRHDAWAEANRAPVEVEKTGTERGKFLNPEVFGQPESARLNSTPMRGTQAAR